MKSCEFIRVNNPYEPEQEEIQCIWVQRPTSWLGGWARHGWLKKHFGKRALYIASPEGWEKLCKNNEVMILVEENGLYVEKKKMVALLLANLLMIPDCPRWINDQLENVAPPGVSLSNKQLAKNRLRCYHTVVVPWRLKCEKISPKNVCDEKFEEWLSNKFMVASGDVSCPDHIRKTLMINVRER